MISEMRYYPYGATRLGEMGTDRRYTGQRLEAGTGLYDYNARYYDPYLNRFIQADTIVPEPGNPQALNRYSYTLNNPVRYTDPSGHWLETALDIAGIAYDLYEIKRDGLNWVNGAALVVDVACAAAPIATGGGMAVRAIAHADDAVDAARVVSRVDDFADVIRAADRIEDAHDALAASRRLKTLATGSDEASYLARAIAQQYTNGSGTRVLLGQWVEGGGYVAEAMKNGGIFYQTAPEFFDAVGKSDEISWLVNEQFLVNQLGSGVKQI